MCLEVDVKKMFEGQYRMGKQEEEFNLKQSHACSLSKESIETIFNKERKCICLHRQQKEILVVN